MIEKLESYYECNERGDIISYGMVSNYDILDKINELVDAVNRMEKQIEKLQML